MGGILRGNLGEGNCESKSEASRCLTSPLGKGEVKWRCLEPQTLFSRKWRLGPLSGVRGLPIFVASRQEGVLYRHPASVTSSEKPLQLLGHIPSTAGTFRKKFRKNSGKTPETLSELFLEFPSRVRLGSPKPYNCRVFLNFEPQIFHYSWVELKGGGGQNAPKSKPREDALLETSF